MIIEKMNLLQKNNYKDSQLKSLRNTILIVFFVKFLFYLLLIIP